MFQECLPLLTKQKACLEKWTKGVHQVFGGRLSSIDEVGLVWLVRRCEAMGAPLVRRTWPQSRLSLMEVCGCAPHAPELSQVGPTVFQPSFTDYPESTAGDSSPLFGRSGDSCLSGETTVAAVGHPDRSC